MEEIIEDIEFLILRIVEEVVENRVSREFFLNILKDLKESH